MWWIDHIGVVASDLDRSVHFYGVLFDRPPLERVIWRGQDAEYVARMLGVPGLALQAAFFEIPYSSTILELLEFRGTWDQKSTEVVRPTVPGATHFGFFVHSIDEAAQRLERLGTTFLARPVEIPYGPYRGGRSAYFQDPDGVNLQLMEVQSRPGGLPVLRPSEPVPAYETG